MPCRLMRFFLVVFLFVCLPSLFLRGRCPQPLPTHHRIATRCTSSPWRFVASLFVVLARSAPPRSRSLGGFVKSVRYDAKRRLVQGQHKELALRLPSVEEAEKWVAALTAGAVLRA